MSGDQRPRPRAFRLDDDKVLVSEPDAPAAAEFRKTGGVVSAPAPDAFAPDDEPAEPKSNEEAVEIAMAAPRPDMKTLETDVYVRY